MKTLWKFGDGLLIGFGIATAIIISSVVYATYSTLTVSTGDTLSKDKWNELVSYTVPPGSVIAYNGTSCPTGWTEAAGTGVPTGNGGSSTLDLRGEFIRGWDHGKGTDTGRNFGEWQKGSLMAMNVWTDNGYMNSFHWYSSTSVESDHNSARNYFGLDSGNLSNYVDAGNNTYLGWLGGWTYRNLPIAGNMKDSDGPKDFAFWSSRPRNIALIYCVKN